jgi:hypothetical protein
LVAYIFQQLSKQGKTQGIDQSVRQRDTRTWFREAARSLTQVDRNRLMRDKKNTVTKIASEDIGKMFMFSYDPKWKDELPYYDAFPLIFVVESYTDGFLGINLHYLPPILRAKLMDSLYSISSDNKYNENTKLNISYKILKSAARFKYFKPCVKRYLFAHVRSRYLNVEPMYWDAALMLPSENFKKATTERIYRESRNTV